MYHIFVVLHSSEKLFLPLPAILLIFSSPAYVCVGED